MINNITNEITEARPYWQDISLIYNMWKRYPAGTEARIGGGGGGTGPMLAASAGGRSVKSLARPKYTGITYPLKNTTQHAVATTVPKVIKAELGNQGFNLATTGEFGPTLPEGLLGIIDYFNPLTGGQINPINQAYPGEQPIMGGEEDDWGTNWDITPSNEASW